MSRRRPRLSGSRRRVALLLSLALPVTAAAQPGSIVHSPHNLSASGPGEVRAASEEQICIFCHTPHNASPVQPLWNRDIPATAYQVYSSNSLNAAPGQPTGSSKLCLSCHDGTIAVGSVRSRGQPVAMAGGMTTMRPGAANLGTDLSDDHPISFRYDEALVQKNPRLASPASLPQGIRLDHQQELQCTSCHNAHSNVNGKFLVMDNSQSQLCRSCHTLSETTVSGHAQCASCHQPHSAPSGPYLLRGTTVTQTCLTCHSSVPGTEQAANIAADLSKLSRHDTDSPVNLVNHAPNNVVCSNCHEPHTMHPGTAVAPAISPRLGMVRGVNSAGAPVARAQFEYEVCFTCHGDTAAIQPRVSRQVVQSNLRLRTAPNAVSYHPVQATGRSNDVPSLVHGMSAGSMIYCTDCHGSDSGRRAGGGGPDGPHGSAHSPLLVARYETASQTPESPSAYALCYSCHDRNSILRNDSFGQHQQHVQARNTPCSTCHDPHGIPAGQGNAMNNSRLMNFDTSVVSPDPVSGRLEFRQTGSRTGECYLSCHGAAHSPKSY